MSRFGIARNRPFVDGNKRTAFAAMPRFLGLNGIDFDADAPEAIILALAAAEVDKAGLNRWIADNWP